MRFCFKLAWMGVLTAFVVSAAGLTDPAGRVVSVVRTDARTGKLVRTVAVVPKPASRKPVVKHATATVVSPAAQQTSAKQPAAQIDQAVQKAAAQQALPPQLLHSVIKVESNYNPNAVSPKGALGLMQLIPATAERFGVADVFDPAENIEGGARYLRYLLDLYNENYRLALAAYNAGEGAVARYGGVPPYAETQNYLVLVRKRYEESQQAAKQNESKSADKETAAPRHIEQVVEADGSVRYVTP
ncbi:MAG TPA: lytic transglycosylase domain-containing protein [Bryobacteraceae bacterium]|nr:lytic transglycosylase domain-containing protein [Bryobacteraceae bacterium]